MASCSGAYAIHAKSPANATTATAAAAALVLRGPLDRGHVRFFTRTTIERLFVESGLLVGFFLPGDTVLFAAGLLTAAPATGQSQEPSPETVADFTARADEVAASLPRAG